MEIVNTNNQAKIQHSFASRVLLVDLSANANEALGSLTNALLGHEFQLIASVNDVSGLLKQMEKHQPNFMLFMVPKLNKGILASLLEVRKLAALPVVVVAEEHCDFGLNCILDQGVTSYIVDDLDLSRLPVILELAKARFDQLEKVLGELEQAKNKLSERKIIDRAKGILMHKKSLTEEQAYTQLRKTAMNQGQTIFDLSKRIIGVYDMLV